MPVKDTGVVNIHGREYKTVAKRVDEFRKEHGAKYAILTELVSMDERNVVMRAEILDENRHAIATGYAEENRTASQINRTSALENCETSAIGRALANFGLGGGEYASADEVANAIQQQETGKKVKSPDFDSIKAKLDTLKTVDEVNEYAKEVVKLFPNPTEKQNWSIRTMFSIRRSQINEGEHEDN